MNSIPACVIDTESVATLTLKALLYATCTSPKMHLIWPRKFCITFVLHFSWVLPAVTRGTENNPYAIFYLLGEGGKISALWEMCKLRMILERLAPYKGILVQGSGKFLLVECGILGFKIQNTGQRLESGIFHCQKSGIQ